MKHLSVLFLLAVAIWATSSPALGQTVWFKYDGNPVLSCGPPGAWDNTTVYPNRVIFQDTVYRMWYTGGDGSHSRTGLATSLNGVNWTKSAQNPVLSEGPGPWDAGSAYEGYVLRVGSGYKMWYTGGDGFSNWKLGYASSLDGILWTKANGANPVIGTGSWYARGPHNPSVLGPDSVGGYKMWFQGNPIAHEDVQVGYATATNETTWTVRADPVFSFGTPGSWDDDKVMDPKVTFDGQRYEMWYAGEERDGITEIGYATSPDGLSWTRFASNPVMGRGPLVWDLADLYCLDVFFDGGMYHMWYGGRRPSTVILPIQGVGYAVSPKGTTVSVFPKKDALDRTKDTVRVTVRVADPTGLSFLVEFESPDGNPVDTMDLFDDGAHGDSLASDGIFSNTWIPGNQGSYTLDLKLGLHNTLSFEMNNIKEFGIISSVLSQTLLQPLRYFLGQNFPNPFNPSTRIEFRVPSSGFVSLKVHDLLGREVATLVDEAKQAGSHSVTWDATGFPSGVYIYRLRSGAFSQTRKLIVME